MGSSEVDARSCDPSGSLPQREQYGFPASSDLPQWVQVKTTNRSLRYRSAQYPNSGRTTPPLVGQGTPWRYILAPRNRNALPITETELRLMAALAIIGESSQPVHG